MEKLPLQTLRASVEVTLPPRVINKYDSLPSICHEQNEKSIGENGRFQRFSLSLPFLFVTVSFLLVFVFLRLVVKRGKVSNK